MINKIELKKESLYLRHKVFFLPLRTYKVSFEKIKNNLKFVSKKTIRDSISDILTEIQNGDLDPRVSEFSNISKLTEKVQAF